MLEVLKTSWALLLGILLLMVGNGIQGTLLGVRATIENFSTLEISLIMSAYFAGFFGGSRAAPELIRRVGHVRVFAALGSLISAVLILYPTVTDPWAWVLFRVIIGFCFSGVYVTAESWLNNSATNDTRGQALSLYMIVQMLGVVSAQGLLVLGDPSGFVLFVIPSVLVSIAFAPILLSVNPTPAFESAKPMSLTELFAVSPLGCVGLFLLGGVFSAQFGMAAVYATRAGLSVSEISIFIATLYVGALLFQYPIGWLSDRMDRRLLILVTALLGGLVAFLGLAFAASFTVLLVVAFIVGGTSNPLYSLLIAYTNDFLEPEDMAAASGGLVFINAMGAISGPLITGWMMGVFGAQGFWLFVALLMFAMAGYAGWRMTRRAAVPVSDMAAYVSVSPAASAVAVEAAQEWAIEAAEAEETETTEA
ncbi:MAG TPA: MFS transporter [Rhodobacteraceae bacterium]|nr:MFS transporter [Paracoccaceae bacterium]